MHDRRMSLRLHREDEQRFPLDATDLSAAVIAERFRWALRQGHPAYLWPEVPIHVWRACQFEIERTAAHVLSGATPVRLDLPEDASPEAFGIAAFTSGMGGLLGYWTEQEMISADPPVAKLLELHLRHGRLRMERMRAALVRFLDDVQDVPGPLVVLKGMDSAYRYMPDPGTRAPADIDVLVPESQIEQVSDTLQRSGYTASIAQHRPYKRDWIPPGAPRALRSVSLSHADHPFAIEVHTSLERVFDGVRHVRLPLGEPDPWPGLHPRAHVQTQPVFTALLALHIGEELHRLQMIRLVELVEVLRHEFRGPGAWADLRAVLGAVDAERFAYPAFELAERLVPGIIEPEFRRHIAAAAHPRLRRMIDEMRPAMMQRLEGLTIAERGIWAATPLERVRRLAWMILPFRARESWRTLLGVYRERLYGLLRGRIKLTR